MSAQAPARSPSDVTDTEYFSSDQSTPSAVYSLIDSVDCESIADEYEIGKHSATHYLENHVKVGFREGHDPSDSLEELAERADELDYMAASTFSRYKNYCDYGAVVRFCSNCCILGGCTISVESCANFLTVRFQSFSEQVCELHIHFSLRPAHFSIP